MLVTILLAATLTTPAPDPTVQAALALVPNAPAMQVELVERRIQQGLGTVIAWVEPTEGDTVYVSTKTDVWKAAAKGNRTALIELASILVHEQAHLRRDLSHGEVYDVQIATLRALDAPKRLVEKYEAAKAAAVSREAALKALKASIASR